MDARKCSSRWIVLLMAFAMSLSGAAVRAADEVISDTKTASGTATAPAAAETRAARPRFMPANVRLIPTAGAASFTTARKATLDNFDNGFTAGLLADLGGGTFVFEAGILALNVQGDVNDGQGNFNVDSWGIPLLAKVNFSGQPNSTVYAKAGVLPFQPSGTSSNFDVLGVAGIGGAIPLMANSAITLEATYNRIFNDTTSLGSYQGVALMGGLSFGL